MLNSHRRSTTSINAARQPVQFEGVVTFANGSSAATSNVAFTVPAGKRLVIETIGILIAVPTGQQIDVSVTVTSGQSGIGQSQLDYHLPFGSKFTVLGGEDTYIGTFPVRLYADPGTKPDLFIQRNSEQGGSSLDGGHVSFSGYLVNLP
jgi:hypothetical protein